MKRLFTLNTLLLFIAATAFAGPINPEKAQQIASAFWKKIAPEKEQVRMRLAPQKSRSTNRGTDTNAEENYYIFTEESSNGFVIVSGDDLLEPIVGYSTSDTRTDAEMPQPLVEWLEMYSNYVEQVRQGKAAPIQRTTGKRIEPMLKTTWDQGSPYNKKCPQIGNQYPPTGCTATAVAQVMKFHAWPVTPLKAITWKSNITGSSERIDLTKRTYNWSKMLNSYSGMYNQDNADEVAQLMVDVGKAINSSYAIAGTGSNNIEAVDALVNVFDYSSEARIYRRMEHTNETWMNVLRSNLEARQPLVYTGYGFSTGAGHAFVCDGIDENNYLHINWGWSGAYDGFFDMAYMRPDGIGTGGGSGEYSVGQAVIANIHPRKEGESKREGDPTIYILAPVGPLQQTPLDKYEATINNSGVARFRFVAGFLNWSHSTFNIELCADITDEDGNLIRISLGDEKITLKADDSGGYVYTFQINTKQNNGGIYLPKGKYTMRIVYRHSGGGEFTVMPGANNGLLIEVTDTKVIVTNTLPKATLSRMTFQPRPMFIGDKINFEARIVNRNKDNRFILVAPVLNKENADGTWTSELQKDNAKLIEVLDDQEIALPFSTNIRLNYSGRYFISFAYNLRNSYLNNSTDFDTTNMYFIEGTSDTLDIKSLPAGALPSVSEYSVKDIGNGSATNIRARINNIATNGETYSGTLGVFVQNNMTGKEYLIHTEEVNNIRGGGNKVLTCSTIHYFPALPTGQYLVDIRELKNNKWEYIRHTTSNNYFTIKAKEGARPYVSSPMNINNKTVAVNKEFTVTTSLDCVGGSFSGYIKVNTVSGINSVAESDYIPVEITEGSPVNVTIPCQCGSLYGNWILSIKYFSAQKMQLGEVSNNRVTYPGNGSFTTGDNATGVANVSENSIVVTSGCNSINVSGATEQAVIKIYALDGSLVYEGNNTSIELASGLYIVNVVDADGNHTVKVSVR